MTDKNKLLIVSLNFSPEPTGAGKYTGELADELVRRGFDVYVITSPPYYPSWKIANGYSRFLYSFERHENLNIIRCPIYVPKKLGIVKRMLHLFTFMITSLPPAVYFSIAVRAQTVIHIAPTLFSFPAVFVAKLTKGRRAILHVQDIEVDAFTSIFTKETSLIAKLIFSIASSCERFIYHQYDYVTTISENMRLRLIRKGAHESGTRLIRNWVTKRQFEESSGRNCKTLEAISSHSAKFKVLYSGNIGAKQGLVTVAEAAKIISMRNDAIHFFIVGDGQFKQALTDFIQQQHIHNVSILPLAQETALMEMLSLASCHLVPQGAGVGDSVLPSKLINILYAGGTTVATAEPNTELHSLFTAQPMLGVVCSPEDPQGLAASIEQVCETAVLPNSAATEYATKTYRKDSIMDNFEKLIRHSNSNS